MRYNVSAPAVRGALMLLLFLCASNNRLFAQTLPDPWRTKDIGAPVLAGTASYGSGVFRIDAAGADIWGTADQFRFLYQKVAGDVDVVAKIEALAATHAYAKAGIMIRASNKPGAAHVFVHATGSKGVWLTSRAAQGAVTTGVAASTAQAPVWLRAVRKGNRVTVYSSMTGSAWTLIGERTVAFGSGAFVGIAVTSHDPRIRTTARARVNVVRLSTPAGQKSQDIGSPAVAGRTDHTQGVYAVSAAGRDIWDRADQFRYTYQPIDGDADVVARVVWIEPTDLWAKAGVMIRETLKADSRHASVFVSVGKGYAFQRRADTGDQSLHTTGGSGVAPGWVRLLRRGDLFEAYRSQDGKGWTKIGSDVIPMAQSVYVGLAVTSHVTTKATLAIIDGLKVAGAPTTDPVPPDDPVTPPGTDPDPAPSPTGLRWVVFTASKDHDTLVGSYRLNIFAPGANPATAKPLVSISLGKPVPDATGQIRVDQGGFFTALAAGNYTATVSAVGSGGQSHCSPVLFTR
jgi:regulation of enolase protein 1 (concanavalin A-like superfamily)